MSKSVNSHCRGKGFPNFDVSVERIKLAAAGPAGNHQVPFFLFFFFEKKKILFFPFTFFSSFYFVNSL